MKDPTPIVSITIPDKPGKQLRVEATKYQNAVYFNLRRWEEISPSQWIPTKKGVTFSESLFPEFVAAIRQISEKLYRSDFELDSEVAECDELSDQFVTTGGRPKRKDG